MKKESMTLRTLLNLTEYLEKEISNLTTFVSKNNAMLKDKANKSIIDKIRENFEKRKKCNDQLHKFKLARIIANMEEVDGVNNNSRVFELSNLVRDTKFIKHLLGQKSKTRIKGKADQYVFGIPKSELENELQNIENRISELQNQMSNFNESFEVEVEVDESLELI